MKNKEKTNQRYLIILLFCLCIGSRYNIRLGLSIKPYMLFSLFLLLVSCRQLIVSKFYFYEKLFIIFCYYYVIRGLFSPFPKASIIGMTLCLLTFVFYLFFKCYLEFFTIRQIKRAIKWAGILFNTGSFLFYFWGLLETGFRFQGNGVDVRGLTLDRNMPRLIGFVNDPNIFVFINCLFLFYFFFHLLEKGNTFFYFLSLTNTVLTLSRGALLGIFIVTFFGFMIIHINEKVKVILTGLIGTTILSVLLYVYTRINIVILIFERFVSLRSDKGSGRLTLWLEGINFFEKQPLFGIGTYNFPTMYYMNRGKNIVIHNTFLEILVETGIIGLVIYTIMNVYLVITLLISPLNKNTKAWLLCTQVAYIILFLSLSLTLNEFYFFFLALVSKHLTNKGVREFGI